MLSPIMWVSWFNDRKIIYEFGIPISRTNKQFSQVDKWFVINEIDKWLQNPIHTKEAP